MYFSYTTELWQNHPHVLDHLFTGLEWYARLKNISSTQAQPALWQEKSDQCPGETICRLLADLQLARKTGVQTY